MKAFVLCTLAFATWFLCIGCQGVDFQESSQSMVTIENLIDNDADVDVRRLVVDAPVKATVTFRIGEASISDHPRRYEDEGAATYEIIIITRLWMTDDDQKLIQFFKAHRGHGGWVETPFEIQQEDATLQELVDFQIGPGRYPLSDRLVLGTIQEREVSIELLE